MSAWSIGVWFLGEGLGGVTGGTATFLSGAPGAAALYAVLALAAWPTLDSPSRTRVEGLFAPGRTDDGIASWFAVAWATTWVGFGIDRSSQPFSYSRDRALVHERPSGPFWLARMDLAFTSGVRALGPLAIGLLIFLPIAVGIGGLRSQRAVVLLAR